MKSWLEHLFGARLLRAALAVPLTLAVSAVGAQQQYGAYHFLYPYDGNNYPLDLSRAALGATPAEACAQRTQDEITGGYNNTVHPLLSVGMTSSGTCGFWWLNTTPDPDIVITQPSVTPQFDTCEAFAFFNPLYPKPPLCPLSCPPEQKDPNTGLCRVSIPKSAGKPCPECGNPIHPGTGNKFQEEVDLPSTSGQLGLVRAYNSGRPAVDKVLGGFWTHTYNTRILAGAPATEATAYRNDGKQLVFRLQGSSWVADADVADTLIELTNAQGVRTGWRYRVASTEDTEHYDGSGKLTAIERRSGLTQTLTYTDGTDGASSGNGGFALDGAGNPTSVILPRGLLLRVRDHFGRALTFDYNTLWRVKKVTDPAGGTYVYTYTAATNGLFNLTSVMYPDGRQRLYHYDEPANTSGTSKPNALTGITDENGDRFATYQYDQFGRATKTTHHAGGNEVSRYTVAYDVSGAQSTITDPLGTTRPNSFQTIVGVVRQTAETQPSASGSGTASTAISYDANGNVSSRTDFNGNRTDYTYDEFARNLETSRTEGLAPQMRTISTQWHATFRLPTGIAQPLRITTNVYDSDGSQCGARGALCSRSVQATSDETGAQGFSAAASGAPRTWTYTYNANGSVLTVNGPRADVADVADVTTYTYYADNDADLGKRGNAATITNGAGHTTSITAYNAHGQPLSMEDANGLGITMTYDARQRLTTRTVGSETTNYDYDGVGQLTKVTLPDGSFLSYGYDTAHRLTGMQDNLGNRIAYTLDAMGNRTNEEVGDLANPLAQMRSRVFDNLNRLFREQGAQSQTTEYTYDDQGNVLTVKDPLNRITTNQYDALNRLRQVTSPAPISAVTQYAYDGIDQLVSVTDPRSLVTGYAVDGLGNLNVQSSPDTGTTTNTYDAAGNLLTQKDAKNQTTTYAYDALNRVTLITFHDGSKQTYTYDEGLHGLGRLTSIVETNPANEVTSRIAYTYDQHGRVGSDTRTVNGVHVTAYRYDNAGRLDQVTYPSGRTVTYSFDIAGRVSQIAAQTAGQAQTIVSGVTYHPFGGVKAFSFGSPAQTYARTYDQDGRIDTYTLAGAGYTVGYDVASRIEFIKETLNSPNTNTYGYDNLDRLASASLPGGTTYAYDYDAVGNRRSRSPGNHVYDYSTTSNRLTSITPSSGPVRSFTFDANGSTTADGNNTYSYDVRGRMKQAMSALGATSYQVNALGQRTRKTNSLGDTVFSYDHAGRLLAEIGAATGEDYLYPMNATTILPTEGYVRTVADLSWRVAGTGDFDGDGKGDILWRNFASGEGYLYFMNGTTIAAEGYIRTVADMNWKIAGIGDFNGDGRSDVFWRNSATGETYVYLMNGTAVAGEGYALTVSDQSWQVAGIGDFDGDGRSDVLWRSSSSGENYIYFMDGTTISTQGYIRTVADPNWRIAGVGRFDADGKADIFWHHSATGETYLYPMDGLTIKPSEGYIRTVSTLSWQVKGVADLDGDAKADVVWRNAITGENYLWPMDGLAIKSSEGYFRQVELSWQIAAIRDYDGDGRADIFWRRGQDQQPSREYVYLGDIPVAVFVSGSAIPHYIHVDHLNTPRLIADSTGTAVWRWDQQEPFGVSPPDKNPSGLGIFDFPLRFAGQYDDPETGLFYNYFRDYDPSLGRYLETDPLGVLVPVELESATSLRLQNVYAYVDSNPLRLVDPTGEMPVSLDLCLPGINRINCFRFCNTITAAILNACRALRSVQAILACTSGAAAFDIACIARCNRTYRR